MGFGAAAKTKPSTAFIWHLVNFIANHTQDKYLSEDGSNILYNVQKNMFL